MRKRKGTEIGHTTKQVEKPVPLPNSDNIKMSDKE